MTNFENHIYHESPSNIAVVKYWGKHGDQLPNNPSLSLTLSKAVTRTSLYYRHSESFDQQYFFEGKRNIVFEEKIRTFLKKVMPFFPFLNDYSLRFESENSFPHSTGIASSASSMSAIAKCLLTMEMEITGAILSSDEMLQKASYIARLGSGSASRSLYNGWVSWGKTPLIEDSSDEYASLLPFVVHPMFRQFRDAVLIVSSENKKVSSSLGHRLMDVHPFAQSRYRQAEANLEKIIEALKKGDFEAFAQIAENEALTLHSLLMTSSPEGLLLKPETLSVIQAIREFRIETGVNVCFTLDAGPNVHLLYPEMEREKILPFIEQQLIPFCEKRRWIDD